MRVKNKAHLKKLLAKDKKAFNKEFSTLPKGTKIIIEDRLYAK